MNKNSEKFKLIKQWFDEFRNDLDKKNKQSVVRYNDGTKDFMSTREIDNIDPTNISYVQIKVGLEDIPNKYPLLDILDILPMSVELGEGKEKIKLVLALETSLKNVLHTLSMNEDVVTEKKIREKLEKNNDTMSVSNEAIKSVVNEVVP